MRRILLLAPLVAAAGCLHGPVPRHLVDDTLQPRDYPADAYLTASGESSEGAAQADDAARFALLRKIQARIRGVAESVETQAVRDDRVSHEAHQLQRLSTESEFAHGELIRIAERHSDGAAHYALAVLDRRRATNMLSEEYMAADAALRRLCSSASDEGVAVARFAGLYGQAAALARRAAPLRSALAAVDGRLPEALGLRLFEALDLRRRELLAAHPVRVEAADPEASDLVGPVVQAIGRMGGVVSAAGPVRLDVHVRERFPRGVELCCERTVLFSVDGQPASATPLVVTGCDLSDQRAARAAALKALSDGALESALSEVLRTALPLDVR